MIFAESAKITRVQTAAGEVNFVRERIGGEIQRGQFCNGGEQVMCMLLEWQEGPVPSVAEEDAAAAAAARARRAARAITSATPTLLPRRGRSSTSSRRSSPTAPAGVVTVITGAGAAAATTSATRPAAPAAMMICGSTNRFSADDPTAGATAAAAAGQTGDGRAPCELWARRDMNTKKHAAGDHLIVCMARGAPRALVRRWRRVELKWLEIQIPPRGYDSLGNQLGVYD